MSTQVQISVKTVQGQDALGAWESLGDNAVGDVYTGMGRILADPRGVVTIHQDDGEVVFVPVGQVQGVTIRTRTDGGA